MGNKKIRVFISIFAFGLIILGYVGFLRGFFITDGNNNGIFKEELPLGDLSGVVVDSKGNIYCSINFYSRIQVYNLHGQFLYGIGFNSSGGDFKIHIDEKDNLYIATVRNDKVYVFNNGHLVDEDTTDKRYFEYMNSYPQRNFVDSNNNHYRINDLSIILPYVEKYEPDGNKSIIVKMNLKSWMLMGPLPAWLFGALGMILFYFVNKSFFRKFNEFLKALFGR